MKVSKDFAQPSLFTMIPLEYLEELRQEVRELHQQQIGILRLPDGTELIPEKKFKAFYFEGADGTYNNQKRKLEFTQILGTTYINLTHFKALLAERLDLPTSKSA